MRYAATPSGVGEWFALKLGKVPLPILDTTLGPLQARALMAAGRAGVLRGLGRGPVGADALARDLALDGECLRLLLRVLRAMQYAELRDGAWSLSEAGRRYFGTSASEPYSAFLEYGPPQWSMIERLDDVLRSGRGIDFHDHQTPAEWDAYQRAMLENAMAFSWFVRDNLPVRRGAERCLDIAGAHGFVGAELCRKHPPMRSTVLDRREALPRAAALAKESGYADLVDFREGDLRADDLGLDLDVVLLCNVLHHFAGDENAAILRRVHAALRAGGTVGIFDIETPADDAPPDAAGDAFALYFRITSQSTCFRGDDYLRWLREAGFTEARVVRSVQMPSRMLVVGRR